MEKGSRFLTGAAAGGGKLLDSRAGTQVLDLASSLAYRDYLRAPLMKLADRGLRSALESDGVRRAGSGRLTRERIMWVRAVLQALDRAVRQGVVSPHVIRAQTRILARRLPFASNVSPGRKEFGQRYGCDPPWMIVVSPGHACNMQCAGCYASSEDSAEKLPWHVLDEVVRQANELWGVGLVVISGGEPLAYRSEGKDVLDLIEKHPDCLYLMYTNGTMIDETVAARMERLGTLTPAISVEGMRGSTDERRGEGAFDRALEAISHLRAAGVPFGVSATVTRSNCEELMSDEFLDYFLLELGGFYCFYFHYMPTGRDPDIALMPTPRQRLESWRHTWDAIATKKMCIYDFWNHGTLVNGCVSAGRARGYLYIDWDGKVMPCVFAPYAACNVQDVFARGGNLNDVLGMPFFSAIRGWQRDYGFENGGPSREGNLLTPCPIRDHYDMFRELVDRFGPEPEDTPAMEALADEEYYKGLVAYGEELSRLSQPIWEAEYL